MEAMTLGSPVSNPGSPSGAGGLTSPFLPAYLLGDTSTQSGPHTPSFATTPTKSAKHVTFSETPIPVRTPTLAADSRPPLLQRMPASLQTPEKSGGPPMQALFDTLSSPVTPLSFTAPQTETFSQGGVSQTDGEAWDSNWVTVFGFPATMTQAVIQHFSHFGTIVERRLPNQGNWVHLRYQGRLECRKALASNGRVLLGRIMVGVLPCRDKSVVGDRSGPSAAAPCMPATPDGVMSPRQLTIGSPSVSSPLSTRMARPLVQAYKIAQAESGVVSPVNVPQKSTGVVSRAMEYLFL